MDNKTAKCKGRRAAGSYGRPGSKSQKRAASKAVRRTPVDMNTPTDASDEEIRDMQTAIFNSMAIIFKGK